MTPEKDCSPSDARTIREVLAPSVPTWTLEHTCSVLGIDPDMPLSDLKEAIDLWRKLTDLADRSAAEIAAERE